MSRRWEPARAHHLVLVLDVQTISGPAWEMAWDHDAFEGLCVAAASLARSSLHEGRPSASPRPASGTAQRVAYEPAGQASANWHASPTSSPGWDRSAPDRSETS